MKLSLLADITLSSKLLATPDRTVRGNGEAPAHGYVGTSGWENNKIILGVEVWVSRGTCSQAGRDELFHDNYTNAGCRAFWIVSSHAEVYRLFSKRRLRSVVYGEAQYLNS